MINNNKLLALFPLPEFKMLKIDNYKKKIMIYKNILKNSKKN